MARPERIGQALESIEAPLHYLVEGSEKPASYGGVRQSVADQQRKGQYKAHKMTVALRAKGYEAYEFHDRYASIVTVGSYDRPDDPRLRAMQQTLTTRLRPLQAQVQLFPQPLPMPVPR